MEFQGSRGMRMLQIFHKGPWEFLELGIDFHRAFSLIVQTSFEDLKSNPKEKY
jgi:hypothetical protein